MIPVGTMKEPGFRDCRLKATVDGKTYSHHIKVGFSPEKLRPYTTMPSDFKEFWEKAKSGTKGVSPNVYQRTCRKIFH